MIVERMVGKTPALFLVFVAQAWAQVPSDADFYLLARSLKAEINVARSSPERRPQAVKQGLEALRNLLSATGKLDMARAIVELRRGKWQDAHTAALEYRLAAGETVVAPGAAFHVAIEGAPPAGLKEPVPLEAQLSLLDAKGQRVFSGRSRDIRDMTDRELSLQAPAAEGRYSILFEIKQAKTSEKVAEGRATLWVVADIRGRLSSLRERSRALILKSPGPAATVWLNTVEAIIERHDAAARQSIRTITQFCSALVQSLAPMEELEPLEPLADLAWAEGLLGAIDSGKEPQPQAGRWTPFAVRSQKDQALRLVRVWWPQAKPAGMVLFLGEVLSHDRSWTDVSIPGGFLGLAPAYRGGPAGWTGPFWEDFDTLRAGLEIVAGVPQKNLFLVMHDNGAKDGMQHAIGNPALFTGLAVLAGSSDRPFTTIPKELPPLLLAEGGKDIIVPPDDIRRAGAAFRSRIQHVEYAMFPDATHEGIRTAAMPAVTEFFAGLAAGTWKPSARPVPRPGPPDQ
jgi:hypothetical protein